MSTQPPTQAREVYPDCASCLDTLRRQDRLPWMRLLPGSRHLLCPGCGRHYLLALGRLYPLWRRRLRPPTW